MSDFGYVITANDLVKAICVGTQAEADAVCRRLKAVEDNGRRTQYGDLADHLLPTVTWESRKTPILLK